MSTLTLTSVVIFLFFILLIIRLRYSYQIFKAVENISLEPVYSAFTTEKKIANLLRGTSKKIALLNNATQEKFIKIKVGIFNLDFTLSEMIN